jgi:hypothetical protein
LQDDLPPTPPAVRWLEDDEQRRFDEALRRLARAGPSDDPLTVSIPEERHA